MKKTFILFLLLSIIFVASSYAASIPTKGVVCAQSGLNVRSGPSTSASKITAIENNTQVDIISVVGSWYKITVGSVTGYVYATYITVTDSEESDDSTLPQEEKEKVGRDLARSASNATLTENK
ncbi:MAG: SH3 domain-containing protein [Candidatus Riflebacteria bacterium]|nr:SH3 domain-containing protein [Candidatus Riflebacteria bacterium]